MGGGTNRDVSERVQAEEHVRKLLAESNESRVILLNSIQDAMRTKVDLQTANSSEAMLDLINDILDFSNIEAAKLELDTLGFDLALLLDACGTQGPHPAGR